MSDAANQSEAKRALLDKYLRSRLGQRATAANGIPRRTQEGPAPLSFAQQEFWLLSQLTPDSLLYHDYVNIRLSGPLDVPALEQTLTELLRRHEAWRTSFPVMDGRPVQRIHPPTAIQLPLIDLRHLPKAERHAAAQRPQKEFVHVFDLTQGPPLRFYLARLDDEDHRLFLILHHIIFDAFSFSQVLLPELNALYQAFSTGQPSPLPELPIQYADYAAWQRETFNEKALADHLAFWKQHLAGAPAVLGLPTDHPRSLVSSHPGTTYAFTLPAQLRNALQALSQQEGTTLFRTLLAAYATLLFRYSGQDDIVIGTPSTGRKYQEVQGLLGVFVNPLALRADLSGNPSFRQLLKRIHQTTLAEMDHQEAPFEFVVQELHVERVLGQNPLFQTMFTLVDQVAPTPVSGWVLHQTKGLADTSVVDLSLLLEDRPEGLTGLFEYSTDLFEEATIQRFASHWQTLLEGIVAGPDLPITSLPLLNERERQQLLVDWNRTQTPYPQDQCFHQLFEAQAARTPEVVAVVYEQTHLTYRQLNERANQLAHHLRQLGVGPDVLVGLCVERSVEMLVGLLGIHKAGGAYVPLDPTYPVERLAFMLEDSQASVLVTQQRLLSNLPATTPIVVCLDADQQTLARQSSDNLPSAAIPDHLAYVIYTSGSTGKPKGVQVLQRALVNFLLSMRQQPGLDASDTLLAVTTLSFDIAGLELFLPLLVGARVVLVSRETAANGADLAWTLERSKATVMQATPVTWRLLLAANWQGSPSLKILCGGEALPFELAQQLLQRSREVWNLYGPTETTIWSTAKQITAADTLISIGRPIANTQVYVLDSQLQPTPIGAPGELYIGGDGLARGYLHRPELTAERFIRHPFSTEPGVRLYRTGDLARFLPNGELEHLGRLDQQVKIRGFRIELGEIEAVLAQHPAVREAVVIAREDLPGNQRLVAYIVLEDDQAATSATLRAFLKEQVPDYMVPAVFITLEKLPLTPNNKVDRRALPAPAQTDIQRDTTLVAPRTPTEEHLAAIWSELLGVPQVGVTDNFFFLGGHSLLAMRLVARIEEVFGKKISMATLFTGPTIEEITNALQKQEEQQPRAPIFAVQSGGSRPSFFYMHGAWEGSGFYCYRLARDLGPDQPFYALQPYRFDGLPVPPTFEAIAAAHLEAIRSIQPEGPYFLGGFCNGGLMAAEMTRQLQAQGQKVELLALIDPSDPTPFSQLLTFRTIRLLGSILRIPEENQLNIYLRLRLPFIYIRDVYRYSRLFGYKKKATQSPGWLSKIGLYFPKLSMLATPTKKLREHWEVVYQWGVPGRIPTFSVNRLAFFWSSRDTTDKGAWRKLAHMKESENYTVPGWHLTWTAEKIQVLAEQLRACIDQASNSTERQEELVTR